MAAPKELPEAPLRRYLPPGLLLVAVIGGGAWLYDFLQARAASARLAALQAEATTLATNLAATVAPVLAMGDTLAARPEVADALANGDLDAAARTLRPADPAVLALRLVRRGQMKTDPEANPPFTYASLELLLKAEREAKPPGAELMFPGTPGEHVALARKVPPTGETAGFIHLALAAEPLRAQLQSLLAKQQAAAVSLTQPVAGAPALVIAAMGSLRSGAPDTFALPVAGTPWQLTVEPPDLRIRFDYLRLVILPLLGVLGVGLLALQIRALRRRVSVSPTVYQGAIRGVMAGELPAIEGLLPEAVREGRPNARSIPPALVASPVMPSPVSESTVMLKASDFTATPPESPPAPVPTPGQVDPGLFRSYDIRGVVGRSLNPAAARLIGLAFGAEAGARGQQTVVVAMDGRGSSPALRDALVDGLRAAGRDVLDIGLAPSPVLYFATHYLATRTGVMITGSHNPPEYNGLKLVLDGETLAGDAIQAIRARIEKGAWTEGQAGQYQTVEILGDYIRRVSEDIPVCLGKPLRIVVDSGNAVPGLIAPDVLRALGHDVIELFCDVDADFPNHHPDPSQPANLADLIAMVKHEGADIGFAFDGDGDRLGVVDSAGGILWPDRQIMLFAREILARHPRTPVVYDVKCSHLLARFIREHGGEPVMARSGHSLIKQRMQEEGALLAGDLSGHLFFRDRWYGFDDAIYAAARIAEILVGRGMGSTELFGGLPAAHSTPELRLPMPEAAHRAFMQRLRTALDFPDGALTDIDGIRVDFARGWGLIRPSNTTPCLTLRFEGDDEAALKDVQQRFRSWLLAVEPSLELPF